ncbi:MAG: EAL domain-containing protein [Sulfuriflexus sp.]|nr:EAL domain-containing protein [Sulfuriflexus sp.]
MSEQNPNAATALIVADPCIVSELLKQTLLKHGYRISWLDDPALISNTLDEKSLQLVFVDLDFLNGKAIELCEIFRRHPVADHTSLIAINKDIDESFLASLYKAGIYDYVDCSVSATEFVKRIENNILSQKNKMHVKQLVYHDALTGLPNRLLLIDRIEHAVARAERNNKVVGLLLLDLDDFKLINNTLGHEVGDDLLAEVAMRLTGQVSGLDTVARLGGDEFIILLESIESPAVAAITAQGINEILSVPFTIGDQKLRITGSIGIALSPGDGRSIGRLMRHADTAMYKAKEAGRNQFRFYQGDMEDKVSERLRLSNDLHRALDEDEFVVHYQPQVEAATGLIVGMEALVRWQHNGRLIPPGGFLAVAEENGLIVPISERVLEKSCEQISIWRSRGLRVPHVAVNLSTKNFKGHGLLEKVKSLLEKYELNGSDITLEITETTAMDSPEDIILMLNEFKALGVGIAVDDFGTGYSSLSYLKRFPVDTLKIDRAFIKDLAADTDDERLVMAILSLGKVFSMKVVAEGVETIEQASLLLRHQCDIIQGYLFSKPVSADVMAQLLESTRLIPEQATEQLPTLKFGLME